MSLVNKKIVTLAMLMTVSMCIARPAMAEEASIEEGLQCREEVFVQEYQEEISVEDMVQLYKKCAQAEWNYWKDQESPSTDEMGEDKLAQRNYYLSAVEKQANTFEDISDMEQAVDNWYEAQLERYRALYYMNLEGSISLDEILLAECRTLLGADDVESVKKLQEIIGTGTADGQFGGGSREMLKAFLVENGIELEFIPNLDSVTNNYITWDLVEYIQNNERENAEESNL